MFKVYVTIIDDNDECWKHELDGVLYPDYQSAHKKLREAINMGHIEDLYNIAGYDIEEVSNG